jgi:hypothetical protein
MTDKEAMAMALDALESCTPLDTSSSHVIYPWYDEKLVDKAITALKERLADPSMREVQRLGQEIEQEPEIFCMHWEDRWGCNHYVDPKEPHPVDAKPLYTHPPQRTEQEPLAFKIYKPTPPRHAIPNVRDAELPWVYDQDPSSGNVASMWVTPVKHTHPPQRKPLTDEEIVECDKIAGLSHTRHHRSIKGQQMSPADDFWWHFARAIEAAHGITGKEQ